MKGTSNEPSGYLSGFGNEFQTEAIAGALPEGQNSPQRCPFGLYAEQLSGSPFTAPRAENQRSWLYRMRPTVRHLGRTSPVTLPGWRTAPAQDQTTLPLGPLRWGETPAPTGEDGEELTFVTGMRTVTTAGDAATQTGMAAHMYFATRSMVDEYFYNADGELLVLPQVGALRFATEMGVMDVAPGEIAVLPRGVKFKVELVDAKAGPARGYACENYGPVLRLPERGPIGSNGLANARDFLTPVAAYEDKDGTRCTLTVKWGGGFHAAAIDHSPLDVVAWHGNFAPYKYDLRRFSPVGSVWNDHPDPSIFTVLTAPTDTPGTANVDFVIFPPRWMVAENTFRPPWYHMNVMSEFMGLIEGVYDAKPEGFVPGGMSLHNCMLPHGPDREAFLAASLGDLTPEKLDKTLAFMFETRYPQYVTTYAAELPSLERDYADCWNGLDRNFDPKRRDWNGK